MMSGIAQPRPKGVSGRALLTGAGAAGLGFQLLGWQPSLSTSALGAQLTWTLRFGLLAMVAVVNRMAASAWQRWLGRALEKIG